MASVNSFNAPVLWGEAQAVVLACACADVPMSLKDASHVAEQLKTLGWTLSVDAFYKALGVVRDPSLPPEEVKG